MEASMAGQGQGDGGQQAGQGEGGDAAAQAGPDLAAVVEQLGQVREGNEELRQFLQSQPWQQQAQETQAETPAVPELDLSALGEDPEYAQQIAQSLSTYVQQQAEAQANQIIQQHVAPLQEQTAMLQRSAEARDLVAEYPELGEEETARNVVGLSRQMAEQLGQPQLADSPQFWRLVYMAGRASEAAQAESTEEGPQAAHLEGGSGAGPGANGQSDLKQQILQANQGSSVLPF